MTIDCNRIMIDAENRVCVVKDSCLGCRHKKEYCALNDMFEALGLVKDWEKWEVPNFRERKKNNG